MFWQENKNTDVITVVELFNEEKAVTKLNILTFRVDNKDIIKWMDHNVVSLTAFVMNCLTLAVQLP